MANHPNHAAVTHIDKFHQTRVTDVIRELDQRTNDGITVTLLWNAQTNGVVVSVTEERHGVSFAFAVPAADAADAFRHPYGYAAPDGEDHALAASAPCGKPPALAASSSGRRCAPLSPALQRAGRGDWLLLRRPSGPRAGQNPVRSSPALSAFTEASSRHSEPARGTSRPRCWCATVLWIRTSPPHN